MKISEDIVKRESGVNPEQARYCKFYKVFIHWDLKLGVRNMLIKDLSTNFLFRLMPIIPIQKTKSWQLQNLFRCGKKVHLPGIDFIKVYVATYVELGSLDLLTNSYESADDLNMK